MLAVELTPLKDGVHSETLSPEAEALDLDPAVFSDIRLDLRLDVQPRRVFATFTAAATATLECDRTTESYDQPVRGTYAVLFVEDEEAEGLAEAADDVRPLPSPGEPLDLTEPVRDTLLLALPARRIKPGAEDLDIPTQFGVLRDEEGNPIDPRWEALRKLRDSN